MYLFIYNTSCGLINRYISHFFRNFDVSFMVLCGFLEISKSVIGDAKITVRFSFSRPVSHFFRHFEVSFMVLFGLSGNLQVYNRRCQD